MEHTASKLKYIGIWFLWYLITIVIVLVSAFAIGLLLGFFGFYKECDIFIENFMTVLVFGISALSFIFIYSKFKDVNVRRVVPYLWIFGVIGAGGMYQDVKVTLEICNLDSGSAAVFILGGMIIHNLYIQNYFKKTSQYINKK